MKKQGYPNILIYIDDLIDIGLTHEIDQAFQFLQCLFQDLGFQISHSKLVAPITQVVCLRILVDSVAFTISIPDDKLAQIMDNQIFCYNLAVWLHLWLLQGRLLSRMWLDFLSFQVTAGLSLCQVNPDPEPLVLLAYIQ